MARPKEGWKLRFPRRKGENITVRFTNAQGEEIERSTGTRDPVEAAREAERIYVAELNAAPVAERGRVDPTLLLDEQLAMWLTSLESTHDRETVATYTGYAKRFVSFFGNTLADVTRARMGDYQRQRLTQVLRDSLQKERSALNGFFEWCHEQGTLSEENIPVWPKLPKRATGVRSGPQRAKAVDVTPEQIRAFVLALPILSLRARRGNRFPVRARFIFMAETGLRPSTIDALSVPEHWSPGSRELEIPDGIDKARFGRSLPLTGRAAAALEAAVAVANVSAGPIFGEHDYRTPFKSARSIAKLPKAFAPYDLRHHFISFTSSTMDKRAAMFLDGHTLVSTADHYVRSREDLAREAVAALGSRGILGEGDIDMLSANEGSRTLTGVTPLEPESRGNSQPLDSYEPNPGLSIPEAPPDGPGYRGSPETIQRAQSYLDLLRSHWENLDNAVASELLGDDE
jgi:integrase